MRNTLGFRIIEYEKEDKETGIFISPEVVKFTSICGELKDAAHVCIAKHENLMFVTHEDKMPSYYLRLKPQVFCASISKFLSSYGESYSPMQEKLCFSKHHTAKADVFSGTSK